MSDIAKMELENKIPKGWAAFYIAAILFVIVYVASYTPEFSGWSFNKRFDAAHSAELAGMAHPVQNVNPYAGDLKAIEEGEAHYKSMCAGCHGEGLKNPAIGQDILKAPALTDEAIYDFIYKGSVNGMPAFGSQLGPDRTWKLVAYIQHERAEGGMAPSTEAGENNPVQMAAKGGGGSHGGGSGGVGGQQGNKRKNMTEDGLIVYNRTCAGCHGLGLKNPPVGADLLGTLKYGDTTLALTETITNGRPGGMPSFGSQFSPEQIHKIVIYIQQERMRR